MLGKSVLKPDQLAVEIRCKLLHPIILHDYSTNGLGDYSDAGLDAVGDVVRL